MLKMDEVAQASKLQMMVTIHQKKIQAFSVFLGFVECDVDPKGSQISRHWQQLPFAYA